MQDYRILFKEQNDTILPRYSVVIEQIKTIIEATQGDGEDKTPYRYFFNHVGNFILKLFELERVMDYDHTDQRSYEQLKRDNEELFGDVVGDRYTYGYANPKYCVKVFGEELGQMMSFLYTEIRSGIVDVYEHRLFDLTIFSELFIQAYQCIFSKDDVDHYELKRIISSFYKEHIEYFVERRTREIYDPNLSFATDIVMESDLNDLRYLFKYGEYISANEIKIAEYLNGLPQETIDLMASTYTEAFQRGFVRDNKDLSIKKTVNIRYNIGFERVIRAAIGNFRAMNLSPNLYRYAVRSYNKKQHHRIGYTATSVNKQFDYDHRFDEALYLDQEYVDMKVEATRKALEKYKQEVKDLAGPALIEVFGEKPFSPKNKPEAISLSEEQEKLHKELVNRNQEIVYKYMPGDEWSFTINAYPIPEIGEKFQEIFNDIIKVNTLDSKEFEMIQQSIINALDESEFVHIKGKDGNHTDLVVKLHELSNPEKETIFENCVADVNVPVGEVFTSPVLRDTHGVLHVKEVYLHELKYENLMLRFKEGFIDEYSCSNFENEKDNKKYIKENLLYNHETLPIGEFAIGTNTTAYVMANKFNILDILPILIVEKMGPHFAVGDTCYHRKEEHPVYNADGKEIIARDNEKSIVRKTNPSEAYFNCHTDITIPYDDLEFISGVRKDGSRIDIIKNGRFVLPGTEYLNAPFQ